MPITTSDWIRYLDIQGLDKEKQKIIKFIFLWMKYNDWYSQYNLSDSVGVLKLSDIPQAGNIYENIKNEILYGGINISKGFLNIGVEDHQIRRQGIHKSNGVLQYPYNEEVSCICKYLRAVYKLRCNFFHGDKCPSRTNIELIIWAYESLDLLLKSLKNSNVINIDL